MVLEEGFDSASADGACFDLRDHPLQADHFWGSPEFERAYGKMGINEIVAAICADLGVPAEFSRPVPLRARPRDDAHAAVLLIVGSDGPAKQWPSESWLRLSDRVRDAGLAVRVVSGGGGEAVEALRAAGVEPADTPTLGDAVDWFSSCRAVVGVDTGLTHIAVQQGAPTVAIHRPNPIFFRPWPHSRAVIGESCDPECLRRAQAVAHNHRIHRPAAIWRPWSCAVGGRCLVGISGEAVEALRDAGVAAADTPTLGDAVDWFSSCRAVVGVDTGPTHIAVQQGAPTVAIYRPNPIFFRPWRHCRAVIGESCDPECLRRAQAVAHNHRIHRPAAVWRPWHCAVGGRCLAGITPEAVFGALEEVLGV